MRRYRSCREASFSPALAIAALFRKGVDEIFAFTDPDDAFELAPFPQVRCEFGEQAGQVKETSPWRSAVSIVGSRDGHRWPIAPHTRSSRKQIGKTG
jgi:hypothetical protein